MKRLSFLIILVLIPFLFFTVCPLFAQEGLVKWNAVPKTVAIFCNLGIGTGVIVTEDGYIVTNKHVVYNAEMIIVYDSEFNEYGARIIGYHSECDIAVIKVYPPKELDFFDESNQVANPNQIFQMDTVYAIGHPLGQAWTVTKGIISRKLSTQDGIRYLQVDAALNPGNSGGALVNQYGQLIGINTLAIPAAWAEDMGYAIAVGSFEEEVKMLIEEDLERLTVIEDVREYRNNKWTKRYSMPNYRGYGY